MTYEVVNYDQLPDHMRNATRRYIEHGEPVGRFLHAVLCNDLVGAFGAADEINLRNMAEWCKWLYNEVPHSAWGSAEKVETWQGHHGMEHVLDEEG